MTNSPSESDGLYPANYGTAPVDRCQVEADYLAQQAAHQAFNPSVPPELIASDNSKNNPDHQAERLKRLAAGVSSLLI